MSARVPLLLAIYGDRPVAATATDIITLRRELN